MFKRFFFVVAFIVVVLLTALSYCNEEDFDEDTTHPGNYPPLKHFKKKVAKNEDVDDDTNTGVNQKLNKFMDDYEDKIEDSNVGDDYDDVKCTPGKVFNLNTNNFNLITHTGKFFIMFFKSKEKDEDEEKTKWIQLARQLKKNATVCISDLDCEKSKEVCHDLKIKARPQTYLWYQNGHKVRSYNGDPEVGPLKHFVEQMLMSNGTFIEKSAATARTYLSINIIIIFLNFLAI